jgi:hypothetical protein
MHPLVVTASLKDVDAIEISSQAEFFKRNFSFIGKLEATANDIIDLVSKIGMVNGEVNIAVRTSYDHYDSALLSFTT